MTDQRPLALPQILTCLFSVWGSFISWTWINSLDKEGWTILLLKLGSSGSKIHTQTQVHLHLQSSTPLPVSFTWVLVAGFLYPPSVFPGPPNNPSILGILLIGSTYPPTPLSPISVTTPRNLQTFLSQRGRQMSRVIWNPVKDGFISLYVFVTYTRNPWVDCI